MGKTKAQKKSDIRNQIIDAATNYQKHLLGKVFMFVYGDEYFEVVFQADRFMHLTGVESVLSASDFFKKAKTRKLTEQQFFFTKDHPYQTAKNKLPCLLELHLITKNLTCVINDLSTVTLTYKIGLTNLDFTLGLTENLDVKGDKINNWFLPRTLRVKDNAINNSSYSEFIDFVFVKNASDTNYAEITFRTEDKPFPKCIYHLIDQSLIEKYCDGKMSK